MILKAAGGSLTSSSVSISNNFVNALGDCLISFTTANNLVSGSLIEINFPYTLTVLGTSCSITGGTGVCTSKVVVGPVSVVTVTLTAALNSGSGVTVLVLNVKNPSSAITTNSFSVNTYYDSGVDSGVDSVSSGLTLTSVPNEIDYAIVMPILMQVAAVTSYRFTIILRDPITQGGYF
jgi:phospholipid N-methyltransferase